MAYTQVYDTTDATEAGTDIVVGVLVSLAGFAALIGLGVALYMVNKHFRILPKF